MFQDDDKLKYLTQENGKLRSELKVLNEALNYLVEHVKSQKQKQKQVKQQDYVEDRDFKYKCKEKQIENYEKTLQNLDEEHMKLTSRVALL